MNTIDTSNMIRGLAIALVWAIWGVVCVVWDIDPDNMGDSILGGMFHLIWGAATIVGVLSGGWWFMEDGADKLGEWYDKRNPRGGPGGEVP